MSYSVLPIFRVLSVVIIILAGLLFIEPSLKAQIALQTFVDPHTVVTGGTIGLAFAGDKFVGSVQKDGMGVLYQTDLQGQNAAVFAPNVSIPVSYYGPSEHPVAGSLGLGGFPLWDVYVGAGNAIVHISHDGSKSDVFANLPGSVQAIRFDSVGTFKFEMLVAILPGTICHITSAGVSSCPVNSLGYNIEGMDIAPLGAGFGSYDGQLIVLTEQTGLVQAVSPSWQVAVLNANNPIPIPESINFVPLDLGASGSAVEGFYEADYPGAVVRASAGQFSQFRGDAIIASELVTPIWRMHWNGTGFDITKIGDTPHQAEDGIFVTPNMVSPGICTTGAKHHQVTDILRDWCAPYCSRERLKNR